MQNFMQTGHIQALQNFLLSSDPEIASILIKLRDQGTPINLISPEQISFSSALWAVDLAKETLSFKVTADQPLLQTFIDSGEATASAYLDRVKIQFELQDLMLVRGSQSCALHGRFPVQIWQFPRRINDRIQPLSHTLPRVCMRHPMLPDMRLELRLLDISLGGCALSLPSNIPAMEPSIVINEVQFILDANTCFTAGIFLRHISFMGAACDGLRLGCEIMPLDPESFTLLQTYIAQNQK